MTDLTKMLVKSTTKIMKDICTKEFIDEAERGRWAAELWEVLSEAGMLTVAVPEELDGTGGTFAEAYEILRLAGKYAAPIPLAETYMGNWIMADLGLAATCEPLAILANEGEPFQFKKEGAGWSVTGKARSVPWGRHARLLLVLGETETGSVLALMSPTEAKVTTGQNLAGEPRDTMVLEAAPVADEHLFAVDARQVHSRLLSTGALCRSVMMAGALERIAELTVKYTTERSQFGRPLHRFQAIQHHLASLAGETAAANTAASYAVAASRRGPDEKAIAMAKIRINEAAGIVAPVAHQVHGAIGFTHEHVLHQCTRRVLAWRDEWGTETQWAEKLAEQLMLLEENGLWPYLSE
ncbi:acyl-CoA dehydrogenase family protein [Brevibacillus brevis]|uniref:Acyl-CoA dehydrogenase family protein n=1 Tax=Brevibacillus brevis TaxID=1393 RepID=A0ABY9TCA6_BREBE|nr:acyl-CoA dehydrogenase family protein [Brevibacillus brevis]WNC17492.1 acyl-CoA dehydrogenase family protein [Brevibacillus brevis]